MVARTLEARVHQSLPRVVIIELLGEVNGFAEEALNAAYAEAERENPEVILLDFAGVDYINSTGIALIVTLLAQARKTHRRLLASGLSPHYVEIFTITRLADFMQLFPDTASALAASGPGPAGSGDGPAM